MAENLHWIVRIVRGIAYLADAFDEARDLWEKLERESNLLSYKTIIKDLKFRINW